jgi:hypothetical protein
MVQAICGTIGTVSGSRKLLLLLLPLLLTIHAEQQLRQWAERQ